MAKIAIYNTHYEAYAEMLGKPNLHTVFEYILDAHSAHVRMKKKTDLVISIKDISKKRHISRNTASAAIKSLADTGIISIDKLDSFSSSTKCTVNVARYVSLINAFVQLHSSEKSKFSEALFNGDDIKLQEMGYVLLEDAEKDFLSLKGVSIGEECSNQSRVLNLEQGAQSRAGCSNQSRVLNLEQGVQTRAGCSNQSRVLNLEQGVQTRAGCSNQSRVIEYFESFRPKIIRNIVSIVENIVTSYENDSIRLLNLECFVENITDEKAKSEIYEASSLFLSNPMQFYIENPYLGGLFLNYCLHIAWHPPALK